MNELKLSFLGPARVEINGRPAEIQRRRGTALLAYLAVMGEPQPRDTLVALFWPESDHARGHKALRRDLSELNLALESQWLEINRESIGLRAGTWVDVAHFQQQLAICANHPAACRTALIQAASLYRGDFLSGFTLADSPPFDEWQFFQSEHLRREFASALEQLVEILSEQGEDDSAMAYARRWLSVDPLHEAAHRRLMQLYVQSDQQAAALRQYESLRQLLADELDVLPAPETTALYQQIRARKIVATDAKTRRSDVEAAPRHNLPTQTTAFIGREQELADIQHLLLNVPECRLLALVGPGGIGKTRLALAAAAQALDSYANGVFFVSLAPLSDVAYIIPAIAEALHFNFHGATDPKEQLLVYLSRQRLLLVLDNFEHLLEGADLLAEILGRAADIALLVTSRERLNLREEWSYDLQGLAFPANHNQNSGQSSDRHAETLIPLAPAMEAGEREPLTTYSAVQLFLQRARQAEASFVPSPEDVGDIVWICQLVEGMPLGLELAAPWIRSLSCHDIAVEIERSLDFLTTTLRNMPERHRNLRVVFGQTWQRLSMAEQAVLRRLAVFRGGFTREAAEQVTQATLGVLSSLVDKALVRRMNTGRFELHELVRQYAAEQLAAAGEGDLVRERHYATYLQHFRSGDSYLRGPQAATWLARMEVEQDNLRAALQWAFSEGRYAEAAWLLLVANWFWVLRGQWVEAGKWCALLLPHRRALNADLHLAIMVNFLDLALNVAELTVDGYVDEIQALQPLCPDVLLEAVACFFISKTFADFSRAAAFLERGIALVRAAGEAPGLGPEFGWLTDRDFWLTALLWLFSGRLIEQGEFARATPLILEYQKNGQTRGSRLEMADSLAALGRLAWLQGDLAQADSLLEQAVSIATPFKYADGLGPSLPLLGLVTLYRGDAAEARRLLNEGLRFFLERRANEYLAPLCAYLAELELWEGALDQAEQWLAQSLAYDADPQRITIMQVERLWVAARLATAQQHFLHAATLFGLAEQVRHHIRYEAVGAVRSLTASALAIVRKALSADLFAEAWAAGRSMPLEQMIDYANLALADVVEPLPPNAPSSPTYPASLTLREVEVLRLLAQGLTYAQIADTLVIAPRTVNAHLTSIYGKLGASSRAAATRFALDHHLV